MKNSNRIWLAYTVALLAIFISPCGTQAKNPIKTSFLNVYPDADGTVLTSVPSNPEHCGLCHYNFDGGGNRTPYGTAIEAERAANGKDSEAAILTIRWFDSDGDGKLNEIEITDTNNYSNTPTFPGLSVANVGDVSLVDVEEIEDYLTPSTGVDTNPPTVTVYIPNGGETEIGNAATTIAWLAEDDEGTVVGIDLYVSLDNGSTYTPIVKGIPNTGNFTWFVSNRPTSNALIKVEAIDNAGNEGEDVSAAVFTIISTNGFPGTTLRDFDLPGSQPVVDSGLPQEQPSNCANCHGGYSEEHEPYSNWLGSMMAQAAHDPIFKANMSIAQQDAPDSGDLCLRCHNSRGWLDGRSTPTDGSQMNDLDMAGVSCDLCHRLVDPVYKPGISPAVDEEIIDHLENVPEHPGNGMFVFDPNAHRRGPFADSVSPHIDLVSPWHSDSAMCGTCHDVSNPVFQRDGSNAEYVLNDMDAAPTNNLSSFLMPVERTYSEWLHSAYNTSNGVYAPQFAGNKDGGMVASCQDC
ncbi:MAG: multiheme c-type cytochrome, partial [Verrucomicrobiota bacterium]